MCLYTEKAEEVKENQVMANRWVLYSVQIVNLHYMLSNEQKKSRPSVLWCYRDKLELSRFILLPPLHFTLSSLVLWTWVLGRQFRLCMYLIDSFDYLMQSQEKTC